MIVFDLRCVPEAHVFEAWFASSADYDDQCRRGLVQCPLCGAPDVEKAAMAPRVAAKGNRRAQAVPAASAPPKEVKAMLAAMAAAQRRLLEQSSYVGDRFADEARAIHLGEAAARATHGRATPAQTESLLEDGISIMPLPFPVVEPSREN